MQEERLKRVTFTASSNNVAGGNAQSASLLGNKRSYPRRKPVQAKRLRSSDEVNRVSAAAEEPELEFSLLDPDLHVMMTTQIQLKESLCLLADFQPAFIILYDPDVHVIRSIEAQQAQFQSKYTRSSMKAPQPVKVFFLMYGACNACILEAVEIK